MISSTEESTPSRHTAATNLFLISESGCEYITLSPRSAGIDFYGDLLFTTQQQIDNNPDRVKAFYQSLKTRLGICSAPPGRDYRSDSGKIFKAPQPRTSAFRSTRNPAPRFAEIVEVGYMNPSRWRYRRHLCLARHDAQRLFSQRFSLQPRPDH